MMLQKGSIHSKIIILSPCGINHYTLCYILGESDTEKGDSTCKDTEDETETDNESGICNSFWHFSVT